MKIWLTIKFILACIGGCVLTSGFRDVLGLDHIFFGFVQFVINWIWLSYCWNFYLPKKVNTDIDFKDLK